MFLFNIAFSLGLLALVCGSGLYVWAIREKGKGVKFARCLGFAVIVLSVFMLISNIFSEIKYWQSAGYCAYITHMQKSCAAASQPPAKEIQLGM